MDHGPVPAFGSQQVPWRLGANSQTNRTKSYYRTIEAVKIWDSVRRLPQISQQAHLRCNPFSAARYAEHNEFLSKGGQMKTVNIKLSPPLEAPEGKVHLNDYLRRIGVEPMPPATSPFDPGYDP